MKKVLTLLSVAALLAVSCNREELTPSEGTPSLKGKTVLTISTGETKTTIGEVSEGKRPVYWANGDKVAVNGVVSEPLADLEANSASASFTFASVIDPPFNAVYPETIWKDDFSVTLPQQATSGILPLVGYGDAESLTVKPLTAAVKLSVKKYSGENPDMDKIVAVSISSEDTQLSGDFAVDFETGELTPYLNPVEEDRTVSIRPNLTLTETAQDLFIPVPAGTYNFKVRLTDIQGHFMEISTTSAKTFAAGDIKAFPEIEFLPTGTAIDVVITSAADLIQFAQDWNAEVFEGKEPIVHVVNDIVFDSSTSEAFTATNGVGNVISDDNTNYFNGVFEGNEHKISGYTGSAPLFAYTGSGGIVQNLHFTDDCTVTVNPASGTTMHGIVIGRHKGVLRNVVVEGDLDINNIEEVTTATQFYGGLVGRNYGGTIEACSMTGDVICSQSATITANNADIGGLTGYLGDNGNIKDSYFTGNITISDGDEYGGIIALKKTFYVGGISGYSADGTIKGCVSSDPNEPGKNKMDVRGQFIPAIGGITGLAAADVSISDCDNALEIIFKSDGARAETTQSRVGGIAGRSMGSLENCNNYGPVSTVCQSTTLWLGGIAGDAAGLIKDCENKATGTITRTNQLNGGQSNRYIALGGIVGGAAAALNIEKCNNLASVLSNTPTTSTSATIDLGGIIGYGQKFSVSVKDCSNSGEFVKSSDTVNRTAYARVSVGGIAGCLNGADSKVTGCTNTALVHAENTLGGETSGGINDRRTYVGGIVGLMANHATNGSTGLAGLEISSCSNTGRVWSQNYNNRTTLDGAPFGGGIVAVIIGTADSPASVKGCTVNPTLATTNYRGYIGGLAGYAGDAVLEDNEVGGVIGGNKSALGNGGIVSWAVGTSLKNCSFKGTLQTVKNIGGLVYLLDSGSSIDACKVDGATITKGTDSAATEAAVLVSNAAEGTVIKDCGVKGTLNGAAITLESNMITTDGGATVSGTYLLD